MASSDDLSKILQDVTALKTLFEKLNKPFPNKIVPVIQLLGGCSQTLKPLENSPVLKKTTASIKEFDALIEKFIEASSEIIVFVNTKLQLSDDAHSSTTLEIEKKKLKEKLVPPPPKKQNDKQEETKQDAPKSGEKETSNEKKKNPKGTRKRISESMKTASKSNNSKRRLEKKELSSITGWDDDEDDEVPEDEE